jgi:hypothetical protein
MAVELKLTQRQTVAIDLCQAAKSDIAPQRNRGVVNPFALAGVAKRHARHRNIVPTG